MNTKTEFNIASNSTDQIEAWLSNLSHNPFFLNGVLYASVEAFWQSLKFENGSREWQECIKLSGIFSKRYGNKAIPKTHFSYNSLEIEVGSKRHQLLMKVALREQLKQNPDKLRLLLDTKNANLIHAPKKKDGTLYPDSTTIPGEVFSRILMELREEFKNLWGIDAIKNKVIATLQSSDLYKQDDYEFLQIHRAVLGEKIGIHTIMWEWYNGIVLKLPNKTDEVIKVRKPWMEKDDIFTEIAYHKKAYQVLENLKQETGKFQNIKIPKILSYDETSVFMKSFTMEKIDGHTLTSLTFLKYHKGLKALNKEYLDSLTDREIIHILLTQFKETTKSLEAFKKEHSRKIILQTRRNYSELKEVLKHLGNNGVKHSDLHTGNIMIDKNGTLYIIDFGRVN